MSKIITFSHALTGLKKKILRNNEVFREAEIINFHSKFSNASPKQKSKKKENYDPKLIIKQLYGLYQSLIQKECASFANVIETALDEIELLLRNSPENVIGIEEELILKQFHILKIFIRLPDTEKLYLINLMDDFS